MLFTDRGAHRICYSTFGDRANPPLLMVMGLGVSQLGWDALPHRLAERFFVLTFDNRGTGASSSRKRLFGMRDMADDAAAVLEAAGVERANVFGISMGGMIAQELTLAHPGRVRALALGCTYSSYLLSAKPGLRSALDFIAVVARSRGAREKVLGRLLSTPEFVQANPAVVSEWFNRAEHAKLSGVLAQIWALAGHHTDRRLKEISVPTLVISGDQDRLVPVANSLKLARRIPGARLEIIRDAGHLFPLERGAETVQLLTDHFLGIETAQRSA